MSRCFATAALLLFLLAACGPSQEEQLAQRESQKFQNIVDQYTTEYFRNRPDRATEAGIHDYDGLLPIFSPEMMTGRLNSLKQTLNALSSLDAKRLTRDVLYDYQIFSSKVRAEVLELMETKGWLRNPNTYNDIVVSSILSLTDFHFAPPEKRLESVISRLDKVPEFLLAMKNNLENPAPLYVDVAKDQFAGTADFLKNGLSMAFADVQDAGQKEKLKAAADKAGKAYDEAITFFRGDWTRRARGGYSLGSKLLQQKIFYDEGVDTPVLSLAKMGEEELGRLQSELQIVAKRISPAQSLPQVLEALTLDQAKPDELVPLASTLTSELRKFVADKGLVTIPTDEPPNARVLKPLAQALLLARLDSPGPLENSTTSFYTITLPDPAWSESRKQQHLRMLNRSALPVLSIHETYPGHYVQFLHGRQANSTVRKLFGSQAFREGWATYAEQMMLDEGFRNNDPKLRLAQLQLALVRAARFVAVIRVHGEGTMNDSDTTNFFMKEAFLSKDNAQRESWRVAMDPGVISYTLGQLEIMRLREDYRKARAAEFTLKDFHDNLLKHGAPPVKTVREIMLGPVSKGVQTVSKGS